MMSGVDSKEVAQIFNELKNSLQCGVCFNHLINPTTITDCGHTFCSLCIKGIIGANKNGRCPYCCNGTFSRRKGTFLDSKITELLRYAESLTRPPKEDEQKVTTSKTDGFLIQGPKLGVKKKTASRKRRGRATFSLESNTEDVCRLKDDQLDISQFMESQHSNHDHGNNIVSVSLLEEEDENIPSPKEDSPMVSTPTVNAKSKRIILFNKGEKEKNPNNHFTQMLTSIPEPRSKVVNFFKRGCILPDKIPRRKVCAFNQLGSLVPNLDANFVSKYPSIDSILARRHGNKSFKSPSTPTAKEDPSTPLLPPRRSSEKSFKHHYHRRLINDSYSGFKSNTCLRGEEEMNKDKYGSSRRLSKEKIIGAQPSTQTPNQIKTKDNHRQREVLTEVTPSANVEIGVEQPEENEEEEEDDLPTGPISLKKTKSNSQNKITSLSDKSVQKQDDDSQSTQEMIQKLVQLKEHAALLHKEMESEKKIPPSDEEDEIFLSTPDTLPKKKKRPPIGYPSSARKKLKINNDEADGGSYVFPPGTKVMVSALQTEYDTSCYRKFCEIYEGQATFLSGDFDESINILILSTVNEEDLRCNRTVKYLFALASGKLIVSTKWVSDSLVSGSLQNPVSYIVKDFSGLNGPTRSFQRNENTPPLFSQFEFGLIGEFDSDFDEEKLAKLIQLGGGRIVRNMSEMSNSDEKINLLVADKNIEEKNRIRRGKANQIYNETGIAIVEKDWIVESLGKYSLKGIIDYLINDVECLYSRKNDYSCLLMDND